MLVNWWEIGDDQYLQVSNQMLSKIYTEVKRQYGSLFSFTKSLGFKPERLYNCFKYKKQTITVGMFKIVLKKLNLPFTMLNDQIIAIGAYKKLVNLKFPLKLGPEYGELLAHAFFDGYADSYVLRYSNYDQQIRSEFLELVKRLGLGKIDANVPKNPKRDIDLPNFIPRLLSSVFNVPTFYSDKCRIPKRFFEMVKRDNLFGWYFIKGAYLDEGTVTGGQIFIVRGIKNYQLAKDTLKLCNLLRLSARIRLTNEDAYSICILKDSYDVLKETFTPIVWGECNKVNKVLRKLEKSQYLRKVK